MTYHVDIVRNDWGNNCQVVVARAFENADGIVVKDLSDVYDGPDYGGEIHRFLDHATPATDSMDALTHLSRSFSGSYLFTTVVHDDDRCAFRDGCCVEMRQTTGTSSLGSDSEARDLLRSLNHTGDIGIR